MLKNLKFKYKILFFPTLFSVILIITFMLTAHFDKKNDILLTQTENIYLPSIEISIELKTKLSDIQRTLQDAVSSADESKLEVADSLSKEITNLCNILVSKSKEDHSVDSIATLYSTYYAEAREVTKAMMAGNLGETLSNKIIEMVAQYQKVESLILKLEIDSKKNAEKHFREIEKNSKSSSWANITIAIIGILLTLVLSFVIIIAIVNPIKMVVENMQKISQKQIHFQIKESRKDEIGDLYRSINEINHNFKEIIEQFKTVAYAVADGSKQLSTTSQQLSNGTSEQAAAAEQISSSMDEIGSSVNQNNESSQMSAIIMQKVSGNMSAILTSFEDSFNATSNILQKSNAINEIAEKINILAINAAIEAARAGEFGKGFNVVASEIRDLAVHTQKSAQTINELSQDSITKLGHTNLLLTDVLPQIEKSTHLTAEISAASLEQNTGIIQVNHGISQLSSVIQQNSASAEEMAASAEQLYAQSERMVDIISTFITQKSDKDAKNREIMKQIQILQALLERNIGEEKNPSVEIFEQNEQEKRSTKNPAKNFLIDLEGEEKNFESY